MPTTRAPQSPTEAYRADRLRRAWLLIKSNGVERLGGTRYRVAGNDESSYDIDLSVDPPCYCADMMYRGRKIRDNCKHTLAARLSGLDPAILGAMADLITITEQEMVR